MFDNHYNVWRPARFNYISNYFGTSYLQGKSLLELGGAFGDLGALFTMCDVTSVDGRPEHTARGKERYKHMTFLTADLDQDFSHLTSFDIILNTGLFYHLTDPIRHLECLAKITNEVLIFETEVVNSPEGKWLTNKHEIGYDQSLTEYATILPETVIDAELKRLFPDYRISRHDSPLLNADFHCYDWKAETQPYYSGGGQRRFWILERN